MKNITEPFTRDYLLMVIPIIVGIVFALLNAIGALNPIRVGISFVFEPLTESSFMAGKSSKEYLETFVNLGYFRQEYNNMKIASYEKDVKVASYDLLEEENESLKKQISLGNKEGNYLISKTVGGGDYGTLMLNMGSESGVAVGDVVSLGNLYIGIVGNVDYYGCSVNLATNKSSSLEVIIMNGAQEDIRKGKVLSKGVVKGSSEGIKIENISMSANVANGDIVVVNDSRVGEYLVLGYLVGLSEDPALTSRTGFVSPAVDYDDLITVFINMK